VGASPVGQSATLKRLIYQGLTGLPTENKSLARRAIVPFAFCVPLKVPCFRWSEDMGMVPCAHAIFATDHIILLLHKKVKFSYIVRTPVGGAPTRGCRARECHRRRPTGRPGTRPDAGLDVNVHRAGRRAPVPPGTWPVAAFWEKPGNSQSVDCLRFLELALVKLRSIAGVHR
jgi:hypothetical protein